MRGFPTFLRRALLAMALIVATAPAVAAQTAAAHELQAAFVINFARFTTWPPMPAGHPLVVCVVGDDRVADALTAAVRGQEVNGRALVVTPVLARSAIDGCQVLFVGRDETAAMEAALRSARTRPILTISNRTGFARATGIIELFVEGGRMRFSINAQGANRAGLQISSRLLGLAKEVHGTSRH